MVYASRSCLLRRLRSTRSTSLSSKAASADDLTETQKDDMYEKLPPRPLSLRSLTFARGIVEVTDPAIRRARSCHMGSTSISQESTRSETDVL